MVKSLVRTIDGVIGKGKDKKELGQQKLADYKIKYAKLEKSNSTDECCISAK